MLIGVTVYRNSRVLDIGRGGIVNAITHDFMLPGTEGQTAIFISS
jgi:hypothetical protein